MIPQRLQLLILSLFFMIGLAGCGSDDDDSMTPLDPTEPTEDAGFLVADFGGNTTSTLEREVSEWDIRTQYTFILSSDHLSTATLEVANNQGRLSFAQDNPDPDDDQRALQLIRQPHDGFDNWGGYNNLILGFDVPISEQEINALPSWDATNDVLVPGTKVVALDVYYDDTVDPDFSWNVFTSLEKNQWEDGDPSLGYPILLTLGNWEDLNASPDGSGYYIAYYGYLTAPNEWQTVVFNLEVPGRIFNFFAEGNADANPASAAQVNAINIAPARAYVNSDGVDLNPVYFKNLRIIDAE